MLIDRYLLREILASFAAVAVVLVAIFTAFSLTRYLTDASSGLLDVHEVAHITMLKAAIALEVLLPLALYFGIIAGCGRLGLHGELTAMRASGLRRARLQRPLILLAVLLACIVGALSTTLRPWAYAELFALRDAARASSELDRIKPRRFYLYEDGARAVYVERIAGDGSELSGVFIRNRDGSDAEIVTAPRGRLDAFETPQAHRLVLHDATIFRSIGDANDFLGRFGELTLSIDALKPIDREYRTKSQDTTDLLLSAAAEDRAELQWRLSTAVSTVLLALAALALVDFRPHRARFARLPHALGIYAVYYNLMGVSRTWVEQHTAATLWWVPALGTAALAAHALWRRRHPL